MHVQGPKKKINSSHLTNVTTFVDRYQFVVSEEPYAFQNSLRKNESAFFEQTKDCAVVWVNNSSTVR